MSRRTPYASRNTTTSSVDLSNYVEESELESLLGTAASKDYSEVIDFGNDSVVSSFTIYDTLLNYVKWTSVEIGSTLTDSISFIPSSKTILEHVSSTIAGLNLGSASTRDVTNSIASGLAQLPTSGSVWLYLQPYLDQLNTISQWGPPAPQPTYYYDGGSGFTCVLGVSGTYTFTFDNTLPAVIYANVSLERTDSPQVDA
eukprot:6188501-Pleurochrysis_carterae.AAC.5